MAISNTSILIKRSLSTSSPTSLAAGELAFSYASNNIFIGTSSGTGAVAIGGKDTYDAVNAATASNTASTLVRRDAAGNFAGHLTGTATKAVQLETARNFSISGGDVTATAQSFDGTGAVTLSASLTDVPGLTAGSVGSTTEVPIIEYGANGRILSVTSAAISTSFGIAGDTGTDSVGGGETLTFTGGEGITSTVSNNAVTFDVDTTVLRSNTAITVQTINGNLEINGNLHVNGTQTTTNSETLNVTDPLIYLAANNYLGDTLDIGFAGNYYDGANSRHMGFFRDAGNKEFYVFDNYLPELSGNNAIDVADASFHKANLNAGYVKVDGILSGNIDLNTYIQGAYDSANTNATDITVLQGVNTSQNTSIAAAYARANASATATSTLTLGQLVVGDGGNNITTIANTTYTQTGTLTTANTISSITVDAYGRTTALTSEAIAISADQITSGTLSVARGGTGATSFTAGRILVGDGSGALQSLANASYTATGTAGADKTITSLTVDDYGRVTAATFASISGLSVAQGGTGLATITQNGITYGNGTSAVGVTAAAGDADQSWSNQFLTVTNAGVPVWATSMDGGTF